jgi:hypothetical protein
MKKLFMVVHMYDKWRKVVFHEFWEETCPELTEEQVKSLKKEVLMRGELREWKRGQKKEFVNVMKGAILDGEGGDKMPPAKMRGRKRKNAEAAMKTIRGRMCRW